MTPTPPMDAAAPAPRVVLADPDPLARRIITSILQTHGDFVVAAETADGTEAVELAIELEPDLLITEASVPGSSGIEITRSTLAQRPSTRVVLLTAMQDDQFALDALRAGAAGILDKELPDDALCSALLAVHHGQAAVPAPLTMRLIEWVREMPRTGHGFRPIRSNLTNREWEILDLLMTGATTPEMAETLFLTEDTIYSHVKHIMRKLGVHSRTAAIDAARRLCEMPRHEEMALAA